MEKSLFLDNLISKLRIVTSSRQQQSTTQPLVLQPLLAHHHGRFLKTNDVCPRDVTYVHRTDKQLVKIEAVAMHGKLISKLRIIKTTTINHKIVLHCWPIIMVTSLPIFGTNERKRGGQKGKANIALTQAHWYGLCSRYELQRNNKPKLGQAEFLRSSLSGGAIQDTQGNRVIFGKKWRLYCKGELRSSSVLKRFKTSHFEDVEEKVVDYLELRARLYRQDKCGLSSDIIREKAMAIAANLGYAEGDFKASQGWISNVLRRHNKIGSNLHGEAGDMKESERIEIMSAWKTRTHQIIEDEGILPQCLYNADQTGLYYTKLPSKVYIDKEERGTTNGTKQMKSKD